MPYVAVPLPVEPPFWIVTLGRERAGCVEECWQPVRPITVTATYTAMPAFAVRTRRRRIAGTGRFGIDGIIAAIIRYRPRAPDRDRRRSALEPGAAGLARRPRRRRFLARPEAA